MFACLKFFQASGGLITSIAGMILFDEAAPLPFMIAIGILMLVFQGGLYLFYPRDEKNQKSLLNDTMDVTQQPTSEQSYSAI